MRWVSYTRSISSRIGEENPANTIAEQNANIEQYLKNKGYRISEKYSDRKRSAEAADGFDQMVQDGMTQKFDAVAVDARLSSENSGHETEDTLNTQILQIHNYIKEHPELTLTDTYVDNGFTGTNFDRPEFERMMQDVRTGKIQCIVVKDLSRFGRDYIETGNYLETIFPMLHIRQKSYRIHPCCRVWRRWQGGNRDCSFQ